VETTVETTEDTTEETTEETTVVETVETTNKVTDTTKSLDPKIARCQHLNEVKGILLFNQIV
jgi:flagellar biosynthesis/type III secretory pathway chaperone